jgi:hypothetical protein
VSYEAIAAAVVHRSCADLPPHVSPEFRAFLERMLCYDVSKRASAAELLEDPWLQRYAPSATRSDSAGSLMEMTECGKRSSIGGGGEAAGKCGAAAAAAARTASPGGSGEGCHPQQQCGGGGGGYCQSRISGSSGCHELHVAFSSSCEYGDGMRAWVLLLGGVTIPVRMLAGCVTLRLYRHCSTLQGPCNALLVPLQCASSAIAVH